jgi:hypothetical protein
MVPLPCAEAREAMLRKHLQDRAAEGVNLAEVIATHYHTCYLFHGYFASIMRVT